MGEYVQAGIIIEQYGHTGAKEMMSVGIKINMSAKEAKNIAKECIKQSEKYGLPRKKK